MTDQITNTTITTDEPKKAVTFIQTPADLAVPAEEQAVTEKVVI